ncbi:MAG: sulfite exporter TauE/SafE family protein [Deltaproteobacteria bacterium]|nr:sulfite exporter TauE/SafE family protein [Deltaproteobacteria bacterium]
MLPLRPALLLAAGFTATVAGLINTIAGGGSFAVIAVLVFVGMDPAVVNGTLRVGILAQTLVAALTFWRKGSLDIKTAAWLMPAACLGGLAGTLGGTHIPSAILRPVFGILLLSWGMLMVFRPAGFTSKEQLSERALDVVSHMMVLGASAYGGLLQAGVGFPLMAIVVLYLRRDPLRANGIKVLLVAAYTSWALPGYALSGLVSWPVGASLALGSVVGGWLGVRIQLAHGAKVVRWAFALMLAVSGGLMLV